MFCLRSCCVQNSRFSTSAVAGAQKFAPRSRKLATDLKPNDARKGHFEVATRRDEGSKSSFSRESLPHIGRKPVSFSMKPRKPGTRENRDSSRRSEPDTWRQREGSSRGGQSNPYRLSDRGQRGSYRDGKMENDRSNYGDMRRQMKDSSRGSQIQRTRSSDKDMGFKVSNGRRQLEGYLDRSRDQTSHAGISKRQQEYGTSKNPLNYEETLTDEFYHPLDAVSIASSETSKGKTKSISTDTHLPERFISPPLLPGLLNSLKESLGSDVRPTPIQSLSIKWLLQNDHVLDTPTARWRQFLLASETGSGKSIAYLLPVLQHLKQSELSTTDLAPSNAARQRPYNPRALILAPTHELSRQLSGFAKSLLHEVKLRVMCASRANVKSTKRLDATSSKMAMQFQESADSSAGEFMVTRTNFPVDIVVGTPMKLLEMIRGRGWDRKETNSEEIDETEEEDGESRKPRRGRDKMVGVGTWRSKPELGLANVEWVVVDEADVLFDPDFQETTRTLLADISEARGKPVAVVPLSAFSSTQANSVISPEPIDYPFNLVLTSATIPNTLNNYLQKHHSSLIRLASPQLHHLPKTLQTEYAAWTGGNKFADIERRLRKVWAEDAAAIRSGHSTGSLSKVLVFCNKSTKVIELSAYLTEKGIKNVAMTSQSEHRGRGSNRHLEGFLRKHRSKEQDSAAASVQGGVGMDVKAEPHVMVTTSLLSRGLDFSPEIKHVFIVDEPRNMIDFLHRAGRSGRAGQRGKVVVFGKMKGRGSAKAKDVRRREDLAYKFGNGYLIVEIAEMKTTLTNGENQVGVSEVCPVGHMTVGTMFKRIIARIGGFIDSSTMSYTPAEIAFIENMAQEQLRYETIFGDQVEVLRADLPNLETAMTRIQQSPLVAKQGQRWEPTQGNVDEYLAQCNDICRIVPQDFDARVKILHAAHAAIICLVICKISRQTDSVQLEILKRHNELALAMYPSPPITDNRQPPLLKPAVEPRHLTAEELRFFRNPDNLHGKQFIQSPNTDDSVMYEIIGYHRERDKAIRYDVLFDDCDDPIEVDATEMMGMLEDSLYFDVDEGLSHLC